MSYAMMVNVALGLVFLVLVVFVVIHARRQRRRENALLDHFDGGLRLTGDADASADEHRIPSGLTLTDHHKRQNRDMFSR